MPSTPAPSRYGTVAQTLHWIIAALIVVQFTLAYVAEDLTGPHKLAMLGRHKSVGMTILMLAMVRLVWRLGHRPPDLPADMSPLERALARGSHWAMYLLLFAMPFTGWMMSSAKSYSVSWFGLFTWPDLIGKNERAFDALRATHDTMSFVLLGIAILHVLAALKHHFWDKDQVLKHMLPFSKTENRP